MIYLIYYFNDHFQDYSPYFQYFNDSYINKNIVNNNSKTFLKEIKNYCFTEHPINIPPHTKINK